MRQAGVLAWGLGAGIALSGAAFAQGIDNSDLQRAENDIQRQETAQDAAQTARRDARRGQSGPPQQTGAAPDPFAPAAGGPCFVINQVDISGYEPFGKRPQGYQV